MRVFTVDDDAEIREYSHASFPDGHDEETLETWLEQKPDVLIEEGELLPIGRQVTTSLGGFIDLLAIDRAGDLVIVELKRGKTPRETLAQALEYASHVEELSTSNLDHLVTEYTGGEFVSLSDYHSDRFGIDGTVVFNKDQRVVIVGQEIPEQIRATCRFLRKKGVRATCVEFSFFEQADGPKLLSFEIVVGRETVGSSSPGTEVYATRIDEKMFLDSLDENGKAEFARVLSLARARGWPIHWGTKGFSLNVDIDGTHVPFCKGFPPSAVYGQSILTMFGSGTSNRLLAGKTDIPDEALDGLRESAAESGFATQTGRECKCEIHRAFDETENDALCSWMERAAAEVERYGLK